MRFRRTSLLLVAAASTCASLGPLPVPAQETIAPAPASQPVPVLKTGAHNVILDIVVTDVNGRPIRGLKADDFVISEAKQTQTATMVSAPEPPLADGAAGHAEHGGMHPETGSQAVERSATRNLILLDEMNVRFLDLALARQRLITFLQSPAAHGQNFALMTMSNNRTRLVQDFTADSALLVARVKEIPAVLPASAADNFVDQEKSIENLQRSIGIIETIAHALSGTREHINLYWITSGFPALSLISTSGDIQFSYEQVMRHAANLYLNARMTIYTIDSSGVQVIDSLPDHLQPNGVNTPAGSFLRGGGGGINTGEQLLAQQDHMTANQAIADDLLGDMDARTGGRAFSNQNFIDVALTQALEEGNSVYIFAYSPTDKNFNGDFRPISVKMKQPGLIARTREGYYALSETKELTGAVRREQLEAALDNPLQYRGLRVKADLVRLNNKLILQVHVGAPEAEWQFDDKGAHVSQTIALAAYSSGNKPIGSEQWKVKVARANDDRTSDLVYLLPYTGIAKAARLRVVVVDEPGIRLGTAEVEQMPMDAK